MIIELPWNAKSLSWGLWNICFTNLPNIAFPCPWSSLHLCQESNSHINKRLPALGSHNKDKSCSTRPTAWSRTPRSGPPWGRLASWTEDTSPQPCTTSSDLVSLLALDFRPLCLGPSLFKLTPALQQNRHIFITLFECKVFKDFFFS